MTQRTVRTGLECCLDLPPEWLLERRSWGLLMNQASLDRRGRAACDLLELRFPGRLQALFSPQHGLWGEQQANMIESADSRYPPLDLPVYSLYSDTRRPSSEMLRGLDLFLIDLQDVGTRVYTFAWTVRNCLSACAEAGVPVVILDRPNPLGGEIEGPLLDQEFQSFVGGASIPLRHGLTLGELARLINAEQNLGADLRVVAFSGWRRQMLFQETGLPWFGPSPNMPRLETAILYPGQVLLEGTNLSEGRGTTTPFEVIGAPWLDPFRYAQELERFEFPGLAVRPVRFLPTFEKYQQVSCGGVALQIRDPAAVRSVAASVALIATARELAPEEFAWLPPPYEYEREKPPIDILFGDDRLRLRLEDPAPLTAAEIAELTSLDRAAWERRVSAIRLYE